MTVRIGIMQGRLLPPIDGRIQAFPRERWKDEFPLAQKLGFDSIEFIFGGKESEIHKHPLITGELFLIRDLAEKYSVAVESVCADYFMKHPLHRKGEGDIRKSLDLLEQLIDNVKVLGVTDIVFPCVDEAGLCTAEEKDRLISLLKPMLEASEEARVNLTFETDLGPREFKNFLAEFESPAVRVNYDSGNSAASGYAVTEEWESYGDLISSIHVKDRLLGGPSVPLGTGSAQMESLFQLAHKMGYEGRFVIQGARGSNDVETARRYKDFVTGLIEKYYGCFKDGE